MFIFKEKFLLPLYFLSTEPSITTHFDFLTLENPPFELAKRYKLSNIPSLFYAYGETEPYGIVEMNRHSLYNSLSLIAKNLIFYKTHRRERSKYKSELIPEIRDNNNFRKICGQNDFCIITVLDVRPTNDSLTKFNEAIDRMESFKSHKKYKEYQFAWINATCHSEFVSHFAINVDSPSEVYPIILVYYNWRETYYKHTGVFDDFMVNHYLERVLENRYPSFDLKREKLYVQSKNCMLEDSEEEEEEEKVETTTSKRRRRKESKENADEPKTSNAETENAESSSTSSQTNEKKDDL